MARTSVNLLGNCMASAVVARWEGVDLSVAARAAQSAAEVPL
jgi:Na+/H+-dicarboxylate symporter